MAKYKYNVFTGELDLVDGTGGGTNPVSPLFGANIPVVLAGGKNFGKYTNGDIIPAAGKTAEQVLNDIAAEFLSPSFSSFSMGVTALVEVGTILSGLKNASWGTSQSANVATNSIEISQTSPSSVLATGLANDGSESIDIGTIQRTSEGTFTWKIELTSTNTQGSTASRTTLSRWSYIQFYGVGTIPTNSSEVRGLGNQRFNNSGNNFILNTGSVETTFIVALPPGKSISSVIDLDALNLPLTSEYNNVGSVVVDLQEGEQATYTIFAMTQATNYASNHRHSITLS
jgi:hypothetical protein